MKSSSDNLRDGSIEAGLHLLSLYMPHGLVLTQEEIAFVCGCSMQNIQQIERRAMQKLKAEFERRGLSLEALEG
jgi:DNA-directed RNA polymerase sigma subunit (sigma70/sigma32)